MYDEYEWIPGVSGSDGVDLAEGSRDGPGHKIFAFLCEFDVGILVHEMIIDIDGQGFIII